MPKRIRINSVDEIRRFEVSMLNLWRKGELDNGQMKVAISAANSLLGIVRESEIETRLEAIEKQVMENRRSVQ